ncbi:hypothetical protein KQX54_007217 [Cotesia glomerata]|uniref:Uncharacterized protein n=1 Tax=Cotesia glomerata TaxID=32391 RepID=A0AAV7IIC6_COTGL|nr:hypothetical protein KQX54_007217 [Cotesia glomerata]
MKEAHTKDIEDDQEVNRGTITCYKNWIIYHVRYEIIQGVAVEENPDVQLIVPHPAEVKNDPGIQEVCLTASSNHGRGDKDAPQAVSKDVVRSTEGGDKGPPLVKDNLGGSGKDTLTPTNNQDVDKDASSTNPIDGATGVVDKDAQPPVDKDSEQSSTVPDTELLSLLGEIPSPNGPLGPDIHDAVAERWLSILKGGLSKEDRLELLKKYPPAKNCLSDTGKVLADLHHSISISRRQVIMINLNPIAKRIADDGKIDTLLFGANFSEALKSAETIEKSTKIISRTATRQSSSYQGTSSGRSYPTRPFGGSLNSKLPLRKKSSHMNSQRESQKSRTSYRR